MPEATRAYFGTSFERGISWESPFDWLPGIGSAHRLWMNPGRLQFLQLDSAEELRITTVIDLFFELTFMASPIRCSIYAAALQ
jgi:hypothetical protein